MEHFVQTNVFVWISTVFAHLIIGWAIRYPKTGNLCYTQFIIINDYISIFRLQPVVFDIVLCCNVFVFYILYSWIPHFIPCCHDYYITKVSIKIVKYKSGDQHVNKLTDNDFNKINYIDHFVITFLNPTYYAGIMLDALNNILCSKLCWHNRPWVWCLTIIYNSPVFISIILESYLNTH